MSATELMKEKFVANYLQQKYLTKIAHKTSPGLDRINKKAFEKRLAENISIIARKVNNDTYSFTPYMEKLLLKGKGKYPRVISIPTVRDKITLSVINDILKEMFADKIENKLTQTIIDEIKSSVSSGEYDYFIKLDIKNFYDSIDQKILIDKINKKVKKRELLNLITKAIQTPTVPEGKRGKVTEIPQIGVPQGISISNILANIYLNEVDNKFKKYKGIMYFRYVDDILIFCKQSKKSWVNEKIKSEICEKLVLSLNDKVNEGLLTKGFDYLGYSYVKIKGNYYGFTVKESNILKLEASILKIFKTYSHDKNSQQFIWNLNNRITGLVLDGDKYGWLFFYSQVDDKSVLYHLDWFIKKMCGIYAVKPALQKRIKKFVKAYYEIIMKRGKSGYIPNSDGFSLGEQKKTLQYIYDYKKKELDLMSDDEIKALFKRKMYQSVKDLEKDVQSIS